MRILLIEDERDIIAFLKPALENECFAVDVVLDGDLGATFGKLHDYDLIILDVMLPGKDGYDVCKEIREAGRTTPILMLSAVTSTTKKIDLLNSGADDYLTKPFSFPELMARINALLRRPRGVRSTTLSAGKLQLNTKQRTVSLADNQITLTKKEFMLLQYLLLNKNIIVSRGMIMEHVWDMNADPFSNTIESHMMSLRKKLGDKSLITTVPGRGYVIEDQDV